MTVTDELNEPAETPVSDAFNRVIRDIRAGSVLRYEGPLPYWSTSLGTKVSNAIADALEAALSVPAQGAVTVPQMKKYDFVAPRKFLLLASYCGGDTEGCHEDDPCVECLRMCNAYSEDGVYLGHIKCIEATPAHSGEREAMERAAKRLIDSDLAKQIRKLVSGWNGEGVLDEYRTGRHDDALGVTLPTNCGAIYMLDEVMSAFRAALEAKP